MSNPITKIKSYLPKLQPNSRLRKIKPGHVATAASVGIHAAFLASSEPALELVSQFGIVALPTAGLLVLLGKIFYKHVQPLTEADRKYSQELREELDQQAINGLQQFKGSGRSDTSFGEVIPLGELLLDGDIKPCDAKNYFAKWNKKLEKLAKKVKEAVNKVSDQQDPVACFQKAFDSLEFKYRLTYRLKQSNLYQRFNGWGGNCQTQVKLLTSVANEIYDWQKTDWQPAVAIYADHLETVLFNTKTKVTYDPTTKEFLSEPPTDIYDPHIMIQGYVNGRGLDSPLEPADLLLSEYNGQLNKGPDFEGNGKFDYGTGKRHPYKNTSSSQAVRLAALLSPISALGLPFNKVTEKAVNKYTDDNADALRITTRLKKILTILTICIGSGALGYLGYLIYDAYMEYQQLELACDNAADENGGPVPYTFFDDNGTWNFAECGKNLSHWDAFGNREDRLRPVIEEMTARLAKGLPVVRATKRDLLHLNPPGLTAYHKAYAPGQEVWESFGKQLSDTVSGIELGFDQSESTCEETAPSPPRGPVPLPDCLGNNPESDPSYWGYKINDSPPRHEGRRFVNALTPFHSLRLNRQSAFFHFFGTTHGAQQLNELSLEEYTEIMRALTPEERVRIPSLLEELPWGKRSFENPSTEGNPSSKNLKARDSRTVIGENGRDKISQEGTAESAINNANPNHSILTGDPLASDRENREAAGEKNLDILPQTIELPVLKGTQFPEAQVVYLDPSELRMTRTSPTERLEQITLEEPPPSTVSWEFVTKTLEALAAVESEPIAKGIMWPMLAKMLVDPAGRTALERDGHNVASLDREIRFGTPWLPRESLPEKLPEVSAEEFDLSQSDMPPETPLVEFHNQRPVTEKQIRYGLVGRFTSDEISIGFVTRLSKVSPVEQQLVMSRLTDAAFNKLWTYYEQGIVPLKGRPQKLSHFADPSTRIIPAVRKNILDFASNERNPDQDLSFRHRYEWGDEALQRQFAMPAVKILSGSLSFPGNVKGLPIIRRNPPPLERPTPVRNESGKIIGFSVPRNRGTHPASALRNKSGQIRGYLILEHEVVDSHNVLVAFNLAGERVAVLADPLSLSQHNIDIRIDTTSGEHLKGRNPRLSTNPRFRLKLNYSEYDDLPTNIIKIYAPRRERNQDGDCLPGTKRARHATECKRFVGPSQLDPDDYANDPIVR